MKIEKVNKIFITWKKLKHIVLMHVLNTSFKQTMMTKMQDMIFNYTEILKMRSNFIVKAMFKQIEHEIMILWHECSSLNEKEIKLAKIMKMMNTKIEDNNKKKIITTRKFLSKNIMLMLNSIKMKIHIMKKTDWMFILKLKTHMTKICFIIMIKHVIRNAINQSNQKMIAAEINTQNFRIHDMMKILHVEHSKKNIWNDIKTNILIINVMIFWQTNILI